TLFPYTTLFRSKCQGVVCREVARFSTKWRKQESFPEFLEEMNIPGISGVDTRALTKLLRSHGTMKGMLVDAEVDIEEAKQRLHNTEITSQMVAEVST